MTEEQIRTLKAGKELNRAVARVLGEESPKENYSTDIAAAWELFKMNGILGLLKSSVGYMGNGCHCTLFSHWNEGREGVKVIAHGLTEAEAICKTFLLVKHNRAAIEEEEEKNNEDRKHPEIVAMAPIGKDDSWW